jgi:glycosyltransferase involved in cell wall biosynthesis
MSMQHPKISIGMPVYNAEKYLRLALDSLLQQDYADFELIISDNASTDSTQDICGEYVARDSRIRYYRNENNIGASGNHNRVFELASGEYFKWAAHDDIHLPGFLRRCMDVAERAPASAVLIAPKTEVIDELGKVLDVPVESLDTRRLKPHQRVRDVLRKINFATAQYGVFRTEALRRTRLIQPFYAADNVLLVEIALSGEIWELSETLFQRRLHPGISTEANEHWRDLLNWFDPSQRGLKTHIPPGLRVGYELFRAIACSQLPFRDRLLCHLTVFTIWFPREGCRLARACRSKVALKTRLKKLLGRMPKEPL